MTIMSINSSKSPIKKNGKNFISTFYILWIKYHWLLAVADQKTTYFFIKAGELINW